MSALLDLLAQGAIVGVHLVSLHQDPCWTEPAPPAAVVAEPTRHRFEAATPGLYLMLPNGFTAGAYRNSFGTGSVYAGYTLQSPEGHFALTVGAVAGYPYGPALRPMVVPSARIGLGALGADDWSLRVSLLMKRPGAHASTAALHFSLERPLP